MPVPDAQITDRVLMIRPVRFESNPMTAESNRFQGHVDALPEEQQRAAEREFDALADELRRAGDEDAKLIPETLHRAPIGVRRTPDVGRRDAPRPEDARGAGKDCQQSQQGQQEYRNMAPADSYDMSTMPQDPSQMKSMTPDGDLSGFEEQQQAGEAGIAEQVAEEATETAKDTAEEAKDAASDSIVDGVADGVKKGFGKLFGR